MAKKANHNSKEISNSVAVQVRQVQMFN